MECFLLSVLFILLSPSLCFFIFCLFLHLSLPHLTLAAKPSDVLGMVKRGPGPPDAEDPKPSITLPNPSMGVANPLPLQRK